MSSIIYFLSQWSITAILFFIGDIIWINYIAGSFYRTSLAPFMRSHELILLSGAFAYLLLTLALTWFVILPLKTSSPSTVFFNGILLGLCLYGVYDFTNHATIDGWPLAFLFVDIIWGSLWSGVVAIGSQRVMMYIIAKAGIL